MTTHLYLVRSLGMSGTIRSPTSTSAVCLHGVDRDFREVCEGFIFVTLCLDYISLLVYIRPRLQILLEYKLISKD